MMYKTSGISYLKPSLFYLFLVLILSGCASSVTLESLLKEMTNRESLTYFPVREFTHHQFSSYNRESVSPDRDGWYANSDMSHFIRVEQNSGRREFVLFDADGPGAVVRWWMTFYKAQDGMLRVYIDNDTIPILRGTPLQLLRGNLIAKAPLAVAVQEGAPLGEAGRDYDHNFYVPLPFSKHCKITYEFDSLRLRYEDEGVPVPQGYWWPDVFYNIGYRLYGKNVKVSSLTLQALKNAKNLLDEAGDKLLKDPGRSANENEFQKLVAPGDSLVIEFTRKDRSVSSLKVELKAQNMPQAMRSTVLSATFDGYNTLWLPVGEFFGAGYSSHQHRTWMNQVDESGKMGSFWVMPFRQKCALVFINYGSDTIDLKVDAGLEHYKWKPESMYFGASWHEYYHINTRSPSGSPFNLNFINIEGKGVYAGDQISLFNNSYQWWGEGDEKIFVDGEAFPSSFGTGTEDYYGYSFGRQEPFSHPFISQPIGTGNMSWGPTVNMRHRSLDAIPFTKTISSNIELWHWASVKMNYALTSYFYIIPPFRTNILHDIESVRRPVALSKIDFNLEEK